ncbi:MFS transporter [Euzebyella marina]|uniref:MFS transporter n=1 Tax=Euzebyella marina TaxID=1761453 RepID=A0A3G2L614_9FLAO|nr:MFS transporter [Euzebyella marina]AYN67715.1 MFS transporter [Euzebyella marina]MBG49654.1 MFS transporter [Pseudozobellia sp.]|tara:strand:+ start:1266 stop:2534 length:1269 start_codon:yes stop_codon:yes gene_type:complete
METSTNVQAVNANRLFYASCFALITTAFSFAIAAGTLDQLKTELELTAGEAGLISSMWFLGFPISMVIGGLIYHKVGGKSIMQFAFFAHTIGILLLIFSGSYMGLLVANLLIGLGNGCTEAACNPMIADAYQGNRMSKMMNRFHMWFPGGIALGSLLSGGMTQMGILGQNQVWLLLVPALIYAFLFFGQTWPKAKVEEAATLSGNIKAMLSPLFIFMVVCMALTAITEFGPNQWVGLILSNSGAHPMLILALTSGLMAVARFFGGDMVKKFDQTGVLLGSAVLALVGLYLFSSQTGAMAYVAAIFFALGIAYFWPNMLGFIADKIPKSGALGLSILGGVGMFSSSIFQPIIGTWIDADQEMAAAQGLTGNELNLVAGQATIGTMTVFPIILIVLFTILYFWVRKMKASTSAQAHSEAESTAM